MFRTMVALVMGIGIATRADWTPATPDYQWSFPGDHWTHDGFKTEWWYFTGHLGTETAPERRFGYQFTIFRVGVSPDDPPLQSNWAARNLFMGHAAVTDLTDGRHVFSEVLYREIPMLASFNAFPDTTIAWSRAVAGSQGDWRLVWNGSAFDFTMRDDRRGIGLALSTAPERPLIFQGPNGYSQKGTEVGAASLYYSMTRLRTSGTLTVGGTTHAVRGRSWMDKEFGSNQLSDRQRGWDWFSIQLDDGRDIMLYVLRDADGKTDFRQGTLVPPSGPPMFMDSTAWQVSSTRRWTSPETGTDYPAGWSVWIAGVEQDLVLTPRLPHQENVSDLIADLFYWEGAVDVRSPSGARLGAGYVELTGYGAGSRPAL